MILPFILVAVGMLLAGGATLNAYLSARKIAAEYQAHFVEYSTQGPFKFSVWDMRHPISEEQPDVGDVIRAVALAFQALAPSVWTEFKTVAALTGLRIIVNADNAWTDGFGRRVGGLALDDGAIEVGADLSALCHELAHVLEKKLDHVVDEEHAHWDSKGITAADIAYRAALAKETP